METTVHDTHFEMWFDKQVDRDDLVGILAEAFRR